jgi:hypothetical protein
MWNVGVYEVEWFQTKEANPFQVNKVIHMTSEIKETFHCANRPVGQKDD